ncbi:DUF2145 domain-containing protein [Piscinibacter sp. HJYY11]|nr:DUF2145 domain-containing protein [Piscinibacter sp. HJYY11]
MSRWVARWLFKSAVLLGLCGAALSAHAGSYRFCDKPLDLDAAQKDRLFRLGGVIKDALEQHATAGVALMSRSGLDLDRFGHRYSHAGVSLKANTDTPWAVRQLYYACDEGRPRIFDQGIAGFLLGTEDPKEGYVSVVFLPEAAAQRLEAAALDKRGALSLLAGTYSANAFAFSDRYQNCNQWVAELLASAWSDATITSRTEAQEWLVQRDYQPSHFDIHHRWLLSIAMAFVPWLHRDDHPPEDLDAATLRISMPVAIEAFVRQQVPGATRMEFCHNERHMVVRRGWEPIAEGCMPGEGDTVILYD